MTVVKFVQTNFIDLQTKNIDETKASCNETVIADLDWGLRWLTIMVLVRPVYVKLTNIIYRYSTVLLISFFVKTYEILMSGSLNALKVKVSWECLIGILELDVSSYLHTNVLIMSLISSSQKYFKYICRGRNEHEQGIKREKMTDILPRNHCPNICTKYLFLYKTNFTMKGAQQISLFLTFFTRQGSSVHANVYYKLYKSDAIFHPLTKAW